MEEKGKGKGDCYHKLQPKLPVKGIIKGPMLVRCGGMCWFEGVGHVLELTCTSNCEYEGV